MMNQQEIASELKNIKLWEEAERLYGPYMTPDKALYMLGEMGYNETAVNEMIRQRRIQRNYIPGTAQTPTRPPQTLSDLPGGLPPPKRSFSESVIEGWKENWPQYSLGMAAGIGAGLATGGMSVPAQVGISALASAAGGVTGKGLQQAYKISAVNPETGYYGLPGAPRSFGDMYEQQAKAAIEEGIADAVGNIGTRAVVRMARPVLAPARETLLPGVTRASQRLAGAISEVPAEELSPRAGKVLTKRLGLSVGQQVESPLLDIGENVASASLLGAKRMTPLKTTLQPKGLNILAKQASDELWEQAARGTHAEVGDQFLEAVLDKKNAAKRIITKLYEYVDELTKGIDSVDITPLKMSAQDIAAEAAKSRGLGSSQGMSRLAKRVMGLPDTVNFRTAQEIRSNLLEEVRKLESLLGTKLPKVNRVATTMAGQLDEIMEQASKLHSPEAYSAWRTANAANKKLYQDVLSNQYIESAVKIADVRPQDVAKSLFRPNAIKPVRAAKKILPKKTWNSLVASYMDDLLIPPTGEPIMGKSFLKKFNSLGDDVLAEMFSKEQIANIREVGLIARLVQDPIGGRGGSMLIQLTQAGAIVGLATGGYYYESPEAMKGAGILLLGPAVLGRIMTNPTGIKWLTKGLTTPKWAPQATVIGVKILKAARGAPDIEGPKVPEMPEIKAPKLPETWNPFKDFPGPPRILPEGGLFGDEEKREKQTNLILKSS